MTSELKVDKISPASGTSFTLGDSGDTFTIPSGATIANSGLQLGLVEIMLLLFLLEITETKMLLME